MSSNQPLPCYKNRHRYPNPRYDRDGNVFNRGNVSDCRDYNNNNHGYSRNVNRGNRNFRSDDNRPPYFQRDQSSSRPFNGNQQEGLNVNNKVATQHV